MNKDIRLLEEAYDRVQLNEFVVVPLTPEGKALFLSLAHGNPILAAVYYLLCWWVGLGIMHYTVEFPLIDKLKNIWKGFRLNSEEMEDAITKAQAALSGNQKGRVTQLAKRLRSALKEKDYEEAAVVAERLKAYINYTVPKSLSK